MLVLTRKIGEQVIIDGNKVRLGIQAPQSITVDRAEIHARRLAEEAEQRARRSSEREPVAV